MDVLPVAHDEVGAATDAITSAFRTRPVWGAALAGPHGGTGSIPGMDPTEPIPDTPAELDEPEALPDPPIESTPEEPGGDPGGQPAPA